jgi:hypothetical protein
MVPPHDNKQWRDACRQAGVVGADIKRASKEFHAEKRASGDRRHMPYGNLIIWLQAWKGDQCRRR